MKRSPLLGAMVILVATLVTFWMKRTKPELMPMVTDKRAHHVPVVPADKTKVDRADDMGSAQSRGATRTTASPAASAPTSNVGHFGFTPGRKSRAEIEAMERERIVARAEQHDLRFSPLYKELGFTEEQRNKLISLKVKEEETAARLVREAILKTLEDRDARPKAVEAAQARARADYLAGVRETFGEDTASGIAVFEAAAPVSYLVDRIATPLRDVSPLTPQQTRSLREAVARASMDSFGKASPTSVRPRQLEFESKEILSGQQYDIIRSLLNSGSLTAPPSAKDYELSKK